MDVTSLYTNIPQEEGIDTVCRAYETFHKDEPPVPTRLLEKALILMLQENSFQFNGGNYLQTHATAMGTKMAVAFANIFMAKIEPRILSKSTYRPFVFKRFIGGGRGQGGLNLQLPVPFNPGSRPVFFGSHPFAFFRL